MADTIIKVADKTENTQCGFVYIFKRENVYKIGCSTDIRRREKTLNNASKTKYKGKMIYCVYSKDYLKTEKMVQTDVRLCNIVREWFILSDEDIDYLINKYGFLVVIND